MDRKFIVNLTTVEGMLVFGYRENTLVLYENDSEMSLKQIQWLATHLPKEVTELESIVRTIKGVMMEVAMDVSFDAFWNAYGHKINRKRCVLLYNRLSEAKKVLVIQSISAYDGYLRRSNGRAKQDPETYLKKESFLNNWSSL